MLEESESEKALSKKVCSETSFQRDKQTKKDSQKLQNDFLFSLKTPDKKLSKSLNDLFKHGYHEFTSTRRSDAFGLPEKNNPNWFNVSVFNEYNNSNRIAGRRILTLLILNAWRRRRTEFASAQEKIQTLNNKVEGFEMQVYVLRQLLNAEKKRLVEANGHICDLMRKIGDGNKEKSNMIKKNEELKSDFGKLLEHCSQIENALRNQENDIITSRIEAENWEKQLEKEREKLKKMENEEIFLKEKIQLNEKVILLKTQQIEQLVQTNKDLQQKLDAQIPLWDETMAQVDAANAKLKESEALKSELEKTLEGKDKEIKELKLTIAHLEKRLQEEDERNGLLGKSILEKTNELHLVEKKFLELSKNSFPWSGGIIKVASLCAKIPVACICTVGSLLLPFPSYRL